VATILRPGVGKGGMGPVPTPAGTRLWATVVPLRRRGPYCTHFTDEETEAQEGDREGAHSLPFNQALGPRGQVDAGGQR
jgi:hypothetical protein